MAPVRFEIGFPIFPDVTQLDFTGPWEVLTRVPGARCHLVAATREPVRCAGGMEILPGTTYADCPPLDIVCVPGGPGHLAAMEDAALIAFLRGQAARCRFVTAVCTGALVLAAAGLLDGYRATTHWMSLDRLATFGITASTDRVVIDRNRMTGGGVTAGIDFGLALAAQLTDGQTARAIQLSIEYTPAPPFGEVTPATAEPGVVKMVRDYSASYLERARQVDARVAARARGPH